MSKKVVVGSLNKVKVNAIKAVFTDDTVIGIDAHSLVSPQPIGEEETILGAINRAKEARCHGDLGIGLEGGVAKLPYGLFVINYGALVDEAGNIYLAGGARVPLPEEIARQIDTGMELGDCMDQYTKRRGIRHEEGAVGVFTGNQVDRQAMFEQIGKMLYGQYQTKNYINKQKTLIEE